MGIGCHEVWGRKEVSIYVFYKVLLSRKIYLLMMELLQTRKSTTLQRLIDINQANQDLS